MIGRWPLRLSSNGRDVMVSSVAYREEGAAHRGRTSRDGGAGSNVEDPPTGPQDAHVRFAESSLLTTISLTHLPNGQ